MTAQSLDYARSQADGYDNIAPTTLQGQQAWQYAQSDNFLSAEEATAVMRQQLEPYRAQIEEKLTQLGYPPEHLATSPKLEEALYTGQRTGLLSIQITPEIQLKGCLRIAITENGPDVRFTPMQRQLTIPDEVEGVRLSRGEKQVLAMEGALPRPLLLMDKGEYVPTYLRIDPQSNSVELWRLRPELFPTKLMGIDLTKDQQLQLANGHAVRLSGLLDKQGEPFNATVSINASQKELQFSDVSRLVIGLKPDNQSRQQLAINNEGAKTDQTISGEIASGQTTVNNQQREVMQQLLGGKQDERINTPKQRVS